MAKMSLPCPTLLRQLLRYEPDTGRLFWRARDNWLFTSHNGARSHARANAWNKRFADKEAFTIRNNGYRTGQIRRHGSNKMFAHRVIWAIHFGESPRLDMDIDHIDGDRQNNRISNLRQVTRSENMMNRSMSRCNRSGVMGVSWHKCQGKWRATIGIGGRKSKHLGSFASKALAVQARRQAEAEYGYHENHGRNHP